MTEPPPCDHDLLSPSLARRLDQACDRFEADWKGGGQGPRIDDYLADFPGPERPAVLRELILLEVEYRRLRGEDPRPEDYQGRFPALDGAWLSGAITARPAGESAEACSYAGRASAFGGTAFGPSPGAGERQLGKFRLLGQVGQGAFGTVWRAFDTDLERVVAVKVLHPGLVASPAHLERFFREASAAAQLRHPGIVRVHEVVTLAGLPAIVSDFVEGVPLKELLGPGRLTFAQAASVIAEVAEALDYAHGMGVVHRDIKPANILVEQPKAPAGGVGKPLVGDFGLALRGEAEATLTTQGEVVGTPAYMSPEQAAGSGHRVDRRSDVYSLGVVLYEALCGGPPFRGAPTALVHQVVHDEPRPPRWVNAAVPPDLETVCLKAIAKDPDRRYPTARALADDLRRWLKGEPIEARPSGRLERLWRWCRRNPALAAAALVGVAALSVGLVVHRSLALADLRREQQRTEQSLAELRATEESRLKALRLSARLALDRGLGLCGQGEVGAGVLWLARTLEIAPPDEEGLCRLTRSNLAAWRLELRSPRLTLHHRVRVNAVAFSPDGRTVLTGSNDGTARLWDAQTGAAVGPPMTHPQAVNVVAFSPDGRTAVTGGDDLAARLWAVPTGRPVGRPIPHPKSVNGVAFSPDGRTMLTGSGDGAARLWEVATGHPLNLALRHQNEIDGVAFSPDGRRVVTGSDDSTARLWDAKTGKPVGPVLQHPGHVNAVAFSPDGRRILTACRDARARLWDANTGKLIGPALQHQEAVWAVAFSPDGRLVLTGSDDRTARLWDAATGVRVGPPFPHRSEVRAVAFSPDGRTVVTGCMDGSAFLWDAATRTAPLHTLSTGGALLVALSPDGRTVWTEGPGGVREWDVVTGRPAGGPLSQSGPVRVVQVSSDGRTLLTVSGVVATLRVWDAVSRRPLGPPLADPGLYQATLSPDGRRVLTTGWTSVPRQVQVGAAQSPGGKAVLTTVWANSGGGGAHVWDGVNGRAVDLPLGRRRSIPLVAFSPDGRAVATAFEDQKTRVKTARVWDAATGSPRGLPWPHPDWITKLAFSPDGRLLATGCWDKAVRVWDVATGKPLYPPLRLKGHVDALAFSPDGLTLVTGASDWTGRLWEVATGKPRGATLSHQGSVTAAVFSPDGRILLTAAEDRSTRLWDAASGRPVGPPLSHPHRLTSVLFSRDSRVFLTAAADGSVRRWEVPALAEAEAKRLSLWAQVLTGLELDSEGVARGLDEESLAQRRKELGELGGPPLP